MLAEINAFRSGSPGAEDALLRSIQQVLDSQGAHRLRRMRVPDADAEEILNDSLFRCLRKIDQPRFSVEAEAIAWILQVTENLARDRFRSRHARWTKSAMPEAAGATAADANAVEQFRHSQPRLDEETLVLEELVDGFCQTLSGDGLRVWKAGIAHRGDWLGAAEELGMTAEAARSRYRRVG
jgi:DNA-directed RNA polymerase specialized sigma24 family protein